MGRGFHQVWQVEEREGDRRGEVEIMIRVSRISTNEKATIRAPSFSTCANLLLSGCCASKLASATLVPFDQLEPWSEESSRLFISLCHIRHLNSPKLHHAVSFAGSTRSGCLILGK